MQQTVLKSLNHSLHEMMDEDARVIVMGEDILDPYGGAFKVTRGLSTKFPDRVWTTPISEAGFVGVATGMAMRGLYPVVEIMFGDFVMLTADQLVNHAAKFRWMYADKVDVPLVIRAPMGGRRGYGPTHSQTLEKHLMGVPGLAVVAINPLVSPGEMLRSAVLHDRRPMLFIENKKMYAREVRPADEGRVGAMMARRSGGTYPTVTLGFGGFDQSADATLVAYGGMAELAMEAAERILIDHEHYVEVVVPTALHPLDLEPIIESVERTGRLVVCEEATEAVGFGAEVCAAVCDEAFEALVDAPRRVAAEPTPIPNAPGMEREMLPDVDDLVVALRRCISSPGGRLREVQTG